MPIHLCGHDYYTPDEIAAFFPRRLRPNIETIRRYIRTGKLHATKFGPGYLICEAAITRLLSSLPPLPRSRPVRVPAGPLHPRLLPRPRPNFARALQAECRRRPRADVDIPTKPGRSDRLVRALRPKRKDRK
jgi:hypothetical protein